MRCGAVYEAGRRVRPPPIGPERYVTQHASCRCASLHGCTPAEFRWRRVAGSGGPNWIRVSGSRGESPPLWRSAALQSASPSANPVGVKSKGSTLRDLRVRMRLPGVPGALACAPERRGATSCGGSPAATPAWWQQLDGSPRCRARAGRPAGAGTDQRAGARPEHLDRRRVWQRRFRPAGGARHPADRSLLGRDRACRALLPAQQRPNGRRHRRPADGGRLGLASGPVASTPNAVAASSGSGSATLARIAQCESGGDPSAVSADGRYRGKYQFTRATWRAMGGSGDPAAAPEAEQDQRAAALLAAQGTAPWPACGR